MATQYGFYFDSTRCVQCHTCENACKTTRNVEPGVKLRRVTEKWDGVFPNVTRTFFSLACMHCEEPACLEVCPTGAISKRAEDGIVVVDSDKCNGCRDCAAACPYGIPQFGKDGKLQMCDYCTPTGRPPACAVSCPAEALFYGTLEELWARAAGKPAKRMGGVAKPSIIVVG